MEIVASMGEACSLQNYSVAALAEAWRVVRGVRSSIWFPDKKASSQPKMTPTCHGKVPPQPPQSRSLIMSPPKTGTPFSHLGPQSKHTLCLLLRCSPVRSLEQIRHLPEMGGESSL